MQSEDVVMGSNEGEEGPETEEARETVTPKELLAQLRAAAQRDEVGTLKLSSNICC